MGWLWTILIGLIAGAVAKAIMPGVQNLGIILTICLGIGGSIVATFLGQTVGWYGPGQGAGFIGSVVGALLVLFLYGQIVKRK
jgi:uncharacterized membrane protein YeaQ/YmgE (transglycosylase-associated protein family)